MTQGAEFQEMFQQLGMEWYLSDNLYRSLQKFTCAMYCSTSGTSDINELRYRLFCLKRGDVKSSQLPPCNDTLRKHSLRANYQAAVRRRSLQRCPEILSPVGSGWCTEDGKLAVDWKGGQPALQAVLELLSCQCNRSCKLPSCSCIVNGLRCTDMCRLQDCTNRPDDDDDVVSVDGDDDEGEDLPFYTLHPFLNKSVLILFDVLVSNSLRLKQCTLLNAYNGCLLLSWQMLGAFNITQLLCLLKI